MKLVCIEELFSERQPLRFTDKFKIIYVNWASPPKGQKPQSQKVESFDVFV